MPPIADEYVEVGEALRKVLAKISLAPIVESVPADGAYGRFAALGVTAREDRPPADRSHMDGYAADSADLKSASPAHPAKLRVVASAGPGTAPATRIRRGEAARVATGSTLPRGADVVVPLEETRRSGGAVLVESASPPGRFVFRRGEDFRRGDRLVRRGQRIRAQDVALLLDLGLDALPVFARPRVAILATGDELSNSTKPGAGQVRNFHTALFGRMAAAAGCVPVDMGIAKDMEEEVRRKVKASVKAADFVLTTGGTSVGAKDVTVRVVRKLNPEVFFHGIRMDRGRVAGVAVASGKPILMMPGPAQGAMNAFAVLGVPIIDKLSGGRSSEFKLSATLTKGWQGRSRYAGFIKVVYLKLDGRGGAEPVTGETESIRVLTSADCYAIVPEGVVSLRRGAKVEVNLLPGFSFPN